MPLDKKSREFGFQPRYGTLLFLFFENGIFDTQQELVYRFDDSRAAFLTHCTLEVTVGKRCKEIS
ncbi:hypothetical protein LJR153_007119 [Paenibacillus sp. LjRoot153]|uniref:hypothetical protein n=1 Tax=Paenibacillus sp. LjRoot153 TaxID=3342270 RepID=UPI003ECCE090